MINDEISGGFDELKRPVNSKRNKLRLLKEIIITGQNILIVMLWSCALSEIENPLLDPRNIE